MSRSQPRRSRAFYWLVVAIAVLFAAPPAVLGYAWWEAQWDPAVRRAHVAVSDWPAGEAPKSVLLVADTHVAGPDMPPARLARIVDKLNAVKPDLVLLAGDYISHKHGTTHVYTPAQTVAPFARFHAPLGVIAVLGNHDHWSNAPAFRRAFAKEGITLLANEAVRRGPFVIGGVDDAFSHHDDVPRTEKAMAALGAGARIIVTHSPDIVPDLRVATDAVFAGHTHCGQISPPLIGPLETASRYGRRFVCGHIVDHGRTIFVTAGLGTSVYPLRLGARPDVWLVTFGPAGATTAR